MADQGAAAVGAEGNQRGETRHVQLVNRQARLVLTGQLKPSTVGMNCSIFALSLAGSGVRPIKTTPGGRSVGRPHLCYGGDQTFPL